MTITQLYGLNDYDHAKLEVTLTKEDVEQLNEAYEGIRCALVIESHNVRPLVKFVFDLLTEVEK